jgi:hypothetical protein
MDGMSILTAPSMRVPEQARQFVQDQQSSFVGGANPKGALNIVPLDQCAAIVNMRVLREGEIAKRPGLRLVGTVNTSQLLYSWASSAMTEASIATNLLAISGNASAVAPRGYTFGYAAFPHAPQMTLQSTLSALVGTPSVTTQSATFRDATGDALYIGVASAAGFLKWKGGNVTEGIAAGFQTGIGGLWVYNQRLFGVKGGVALLPGSGGVSLGARTPTLYWSGLNNGDTMGDTANGGGSATIRPYGSSQNIIGGFALGNSNFILHENAISVFRGTTFDDINIAAGAVGVSPNIGFPLGWAVIDEVGYIVTPEGLFFITEAGVQAAGTAEYPDPIAKAFLGYANTLSKMPLLGGPWWVLDNSRRNEVWIVGAFYNSSNVRQPSRLFIYNTKLRRFTGEGTFARNIWWAGVVIGENLTPQMLFINDGAEVYGCDFAFDAVQVYQDDSDNYTSSVQCRRMYSQEAPYDLKAWRHAYVQMGSGAGETAATVGSSTGATLSETTSAATTANTTDLKAQTVNAIPISGQGAWVDLTVTDGGASSTGWSVVGVQADGMSYGKRGG